MIPTIKQVMKCYRVIAQIERMKTGRPRVELKIAVVRETKCTIAEVNAPVLMRWQFCRCFISFKEAQLLEFGMIFLGGFGIFYENSA